MYSVEANKTVPLKAYVVGADKKTEKLKKAYVVDADKKLVKLWSDGIGKFLFTHSTNKPFLSSDGISYTENETSPPKDFHSVIYALDKFWACYIAAQSAQIYNSADGENWTLVTTLNSNHSFEYGILCYQNGVFILMGKYITGTRSNMAYSTDGITWTSAHVTPTGSTFTYTNKPIDIRYGMVGGVLGWYVLLSSDTSSTDAVHLCRFNSISDISNGKLTLVKSYSGVASNSKGKLVIRNNKAYMVFGYYSGNIGAANNYVELVVFDGTSFTQIAKQTGYCLGTVWSTDRYLLFKGNWYSSSSMAHIVYKYDFETGTFSNSNVIGFYCHYNGNGVDTGVYVGKRMYQLTPVTNDFALKGAYSDNYGATVTRIDTGCTASFINNILVYGDEGGGFYQEQY